VLSHSRYFLATITAARILGAATVLGVVVATEAPAQRRADVASGVRVMPSRLATAPVVSEPAPVRPANRAPSERDKFMGYLVGGMAIGGMAGAAYGVYDAVTCEECFPGLQMGVFLADMIAGVGVGAAAGATVYVVSWPVRRVIQR
jgi:hypothetical protein